ncbi:hypothetical protein ACQVBX_07885 [Dyella sp. KULCS107]|uniref:hypothetical protein n=1 Tax=Dyella sp. KULCS107 TaxID=3422216 RepID=UPI003D6E8ECD
MRHPSLLAVAAAISFACSLSTPAFSADQQGRQGGGGAARGDVQRDRLHDQDRLQDRDTIYGSQLMTPAERNTYRNKMRSLKTVQEREAFRAQHHQEMQKRAQERGLRLPDSPPGPGARGGMGPGGMGPGPAMQQQRTQTEQETRQRTQQGTPSASGQGDPTRTQTEQEQRERSTGDQSGGN